MELVELGTLSCGGAGRFESIWWRRSEQETARRGMVDVSPVAISKAWNINIRLSKSTNPSPFIMKDALIPVQSDHPCDSTRADHIFFTPSLVLHCTTKSRKLLGKTQLILAIDSSLCQICGTQGSEATDAGLSWHPSCTRGRWKRATHLCGFLPSRPSYKILNLKRCTNFQIILNGNSEKLRSSVMNLKKYLTVTVSLSMPDPLILSTWVNY